MVQKKNFHWQLIGLNFLFWLTITVVAASLYFLSLGDDYDGGWLNFFLEAIAHLDVLGCCFYPAFCFDQIFKEERIRID